MIRINFKDDDGRSGHRPDETFLDAGDLASRDDDSLPFL